MRRAGVHNTCNHWGRALARQSSGTSALSSAARLFHLVDDLSALGETSRISCLVRRRDRQQQLNRNRERPGDLLMQGNGAFALSCFEVRQITLSDADGYGQFGLGPVAPLTQNTDRVLAGRQPIDL